MVYHKVDLASASVGELEDAPGKDDEDIYRAADYRYSAEVLNWAVEVTLAHQRLALIRLAMLPRPPLIKCRDRDCLHADGPVVGVHRASSR